MPALLLFLLCLFFSAPSFAQTPPWVSYSQSGFQSPAVMVDGNYQTGYVYAECPGANCSHIRDRNNEVVCPNTTFYNRNNGQPLPYDYGLVRRIMPCIKETLLMGANDYIGQVVILVGNIISAICTLAIVLLGALMVGGRATAPWRDSMVLAIKLGGVSYFLSHLCFTTPGSFAVFPTALDMIDDLTAKVSVYALNGGFFTYLQDCQEWTPILKSGSFPGDGGTVNEIWDMLDCTTEMLLGGILSSNAGSETIRFGIIAFLGACIVSKGLGATIGMIGFYLIVQLFWAVVRALYMFVTAYLGVALCIIIAPLFIPTILFKATSGYFVRWVQSLGGFMLQPVLVIAYIAMLISAFDEVVFTGDYSLSRALAGNSTLPGNAVDCVDSKGNDFMANGGIGAWMYGAGMWHGIYRDCPYGGAYSVASLTQSAVNTEPKSAVLPNNAPDYGMPGNQNTTVYIDTTNTDFFGAMGITSGSTKNVGVDFPIRPVDWNLLRARAYQDSNYSNDRYNPASPDNANTPDPGASATTNYLLDVLKSAVMAFLVGYIFVEMLNVIPFIGAGVAMGGGGVGGADLNAKTFGSGSLAPPGNDAVKNMKMPGGR